MESKFRFRNALLTVGAVLLILIIVFILYYRNHKEEVNNKILPKVKIANINISDYSANETKAIIDLTIDNNLPVEIAVDSVSYDIYIEDQKVVNDWYKKVFKLVRNDSAKIRLPVVIKNKRLLNSLEKLDTRNVDSANYTIKLSFYSKGAIKDKFDYTITKKLPVLFIPEVIVSDFKIDSLNLRRTIIELDVSIYNKNVFDIALKDVDYKFSLDGQKWLKGNIPGITNIKSQKSSIVKIPVELSFKNFNKNLLKFLLDKKNLNYKLNLSTTVMSENENINGTKVEIESKENVKELIDANRNK